MRFAAAPPGEMRVRIDVLAEPALPLGTDSRELIALQPFMPLPDSLYQQGVVVGLAGDLARESPLIKMAEFAARRPATGGLRWGKDVPYEYLMTTEDGRILEAPAPTSGVSATAWSTRPGKGCWKASPGASSWSYYRNWVFPSGWKLFVSTRSKVWMKRLSVVPPAHFCRW
ncbi:MAG: hypothetical protein R3C44_14910 [Chloroflexota bacterium]